MKKILAFTALAGLIALFGLTSIVSAQDGPSLTADPSTVPAEGDYTFTVSGSGFTVASVFVLPCIIPGDPLARTASQTEIDAAFANINSATDCDLSKLTPATIGSDGTFTVQATGTIVQNFAWAAGDAGQTETAAAPVFIVDSDDMVPMGGADTGFGGMAETGGNSVAVPLAAGLAFLVLGGAAIAYRRND